MNNPSTHKLRRRTLDRERAARISLVTWVGFWVNVAFSVLKIATGYLGNSRAVVADGVHSLSDLVTDVAVLVGVKFWVAPPDQEHPYGHKRLESLVSLAIGLLLGAAGVGIAVDAAGRLGQPVGERVGNIAALGAVLLSVAGKEWLYRWTRKEGQALNSAALKANAWHHRSDAFSSILIAVAVAVAMWFPALAMVDLLGAVVVACFILHASWKICLPAINALLDKGVDEELQTRLKEYAGRAPGVKGVHALRTRYLGQAVCLDMHVSVDGGLSVSEADKIAHALEDMLCSEEAELILGVEIYDVLVHVDPWDPQGADDC